jgi:fibronectin-binding autotransporter adhesin
MTEMFFRADISVIPTGTDFSIILPGFSAMKGARKPFSFNILESTMRAHRADLLVRPSTIRVLTQTISFRRLASAVLLGIVLVTFLAAGAQVHAAITMTNSGNAWFGTAQNNSNNFTINSNADVLVVELDWRLNGSATPSAVTYNGASLTNVAEMLGGGAGSNQTFSAIYILSSTNAGWVTGANDPLVVNFPAAPTDVGIDAFTLGGVNLNNLPGAGLAGSTGTAGGSTAGANLSLALSSITTGSWEAVSAGYRLGTAPLTATIPSGNGSLQTSQTSSATGNLFYNKSANIIEAGALVSNITTSSLTVQEAAGGTPGSGIFVMSAAVFTPAPVLNWSGATNGKWSLSGSDQNWTGTATFFSNGSPVTFSDTGANTNPITIISGGVQPASVTFLSNTATYSFTGGAISGTASVTLNGTGLVTLSNSNTYTGATTISAGTLQIGNGANLGSISTSSAITDNGTLVFSRSDIVTQGTNFNAGAISGNGGLRQAGSGTLVLNAANTYSGATAVNNGILDLQNQFALQNSTFAGGSGTLTFDSSVGGAFTFGGLGGSTNLPLLDSASNAVALSVGNNAQGAVYSGILSGSGSLTKVGSGVQILGAAETYSGPTTISAGTLQIGNGGSGAAAGSLSTSSTIAVNGTLAFNRGDTVTQGTDFSAAAISGSGGVRQAGSGTLVLNAANSYTGPTSASNGELFLNGTNSGAGTLIATNSILGGTTTLSIRNNGALGSGAVNSQLAPISLNATGGTLSASILEIGATIGADPGGNNADFSFQVTTEGTTPTNGQINLGALGNSDDGTGFAAYNANSLSTPRIVALYTPVLSSTTLATLQEKTQFGQGTGDHLTLGSPTANNTLILLNPVDLFGGPIRRFASIRGVGITPEGEFLGSIVNTNPGTGVNMSFDGNGGLIFASNATSYTVSSLQINGGAIFVAASDPAAVGQTGALGSGTATMQVGTSTTINPAGAGGATAVPTTAGAQLGFMTYGSNAGVGSSPTEITNRNIAVGGSGVTYASAVLGGMTDDYTAMNGSIQLNESPGTAATTFTARNGGRVDFNGNISGSGSVIVGDSYVEGSVSPQTGIFLNNNGTIVFAGSDTYSGGTSITAGKLYVNGSLSAASTASLPSSVTVNSGATLGGQGTISGSVSLASGGILEAGQAGSGTLTLNGGLTFNGPASINFGGLFSLGSPPLAITGTNTLNVNSNPVTINITGAIPGTGNYALIGYNSIQSSSSSFTLATPLPNRAIGQLAFNNGTNELDLDVTSLASIVWSGTAGTSWDTTTTNWVQQGAGATQFINNPGDSVIFDDTAGTNTRVTINSGNLTPSSVTFNNNSATYTISGSSAITGSAGLQLIGTGTVILLNTNTFTGATSIGRGATLQLGNGTPGNDGSIALTQSITDNGALVYSIAGAATQGSVISGSGSLAVQGPGSVTLTGSNTYSGGTTISGGTLQLGTATIDNDGSVTGAVADNAALVFAYFGNQTFAGTISGTGSVTKNGVGTLTLGGANTFSGGLALNQGGLQLANSGAVQNSTVTIGPGGPLTFASSIGTFAMGGLTGTGNLALQDTAANPVALTVGGNGQNTTFSGVVSGAGSLTVAAGAGMLTLANANTFTGNTLISGGTLALGNALTLQVSTLDTSGSGSLSFANLTAVTLGGLTGGGGSLSLNNANGAAVALTVGNNGLSAVNAGAINGSGSLIKIGTGTQVLAGANSYSGGTTLSGGELSIAGSNNIGGGNAAVTFNGGTLQVTGTNLTSIDNLTVNWSTFNGGFDIATAANTFTVASSLGGTGGLNKSGAGVLALAASNASFSGPATVNGGTLNLANPVALQNSTVTVNSGGVLTLGSSLTSATVGALSGSGNVALNNAALTVGGNGATTNFGGVLSGGNGLTKAGNGTMSLGSPQAYNGPTLVAAGTLHLGGATVAVVNPATTVYYNAYTTSAGTAISQSFTATGGNVMVVELSDRQATSTNPLPTTLAWNGVTLNEAVFLQSATTYHNVAIYWGAISASNTGTANITGTIADPTANDITNTYLTAFTLSGVNTSASPLTTSVDTVGVSPVTPPAIAGVPAGSLAALNLNWAQNGATAMTFGVTPSANSTVTLVTSTNGTHDSVAMGYIGNLNDGSNTFTATETGPTTNKSPFVVAVFQPTAAVTLNVLPVTTPLTVAPGAALDLGGGTQTVASLSDSTPGLGGTIENFSTAASILTLSATAGSTTFSGQIGGGAPISLVLIGPGVQVLAGNNTYTGTTMINGGTLQIGDGGATGSLGSGGNVANNSTLSFDTSGSLAVANVISGSGNVTSFGSGLVILSASSNYTGGTTLAGGTLAMTQDSSLGNPSGGLTIGAATLEISGNIASGRNINLTIPGAAIQVDASQIYNNYGTISGSGGLLKTGSGSLYLAGNNVYSGGTTIAAGVLQVANSGALGTNNLTVSRGGVLDLSGNAVTVQGLNGSGVIGSSAVGAVLTVGNGGTYSGTIQDDLGGGPTGVGLNLTGGALTLLGANNNSGPTNVSGGTLYAGAANTLSSSSAITVSGGALDVTAFPQTVASVSIGSSGTLNLYVGNLLTSNGTAAFAVGSTLNISNSAAIVLPDLLMTYSGAANGTFTNVNGLPAADQLYYNSGGSLEIIAGGAPMWIQGSGNWSAGTNWSSGSQPNAAGAAAALNQSNSGSLAINLDVPVTIGTLQFASSTTSYALSGNTLTFNNNGGTSSVTVLSGTHTINSAVYLQGGSLDIAASSSVLNITGNISDDGNQRSLILDGDGTGQLFLSGVNNYTGSTIVNAGTLIVDSPTALPDGSSLTVGQGASSLFAPAAGPAATALAGGASAVPEPGTLMLLLAALWNAAIYRRFSRRTKHLEHRA